MASLKGIDAVSIHLVQLFLNVCDGGKCAFV